MFNKPCGASLSINAMQTGTFITGLVLVLGSLVFRSLPITLGVLAGGLLAGINFVVLQKVVVKITAETSQSKAIPAALALVKFILLAVAIYIVLSSKYIDPIGFVVGLSSVVITLVVMPIGRSVCDMFSRESKG
jgi:hypothetical protein